MIGQDAAKLRLRLGITVPAFGRLTGAGASTIARWEKRPAGRIGQGTVAIVLAAIRDGLDAGGAAEERMKRLAARAEEGSGGLSEMLKGSS